jgi:23S rRNA (adenine2030-N6)-methyltransferase
MLAYRHAFHAGNHADVLKHTTLALVLRYMNLKDKGWRYVDTHAGAGGYSLQGEYAHKRNEFEQGIARLWGRQDLPAPLADLVDIVRAFNGGKGLVQYPGSPAIAQALMRPQDQLRLSEMHPTDHKILASYLGDVPGVEVRMCDGFGALKSHLPPPTRRGVVLIDPSYEMKTDYVRTLGALREALERFPEAVVLVWLPQLQTVESTQLPQRLKAAADAGAKKGWLHARLTVAHADARGFGMLGSSMFVANPPHTLHASLLPVLPWLARELAQFDGASSALERSERESFSGVPEQRAKRRPI